MSGQEQAGGAPDLARMRHEYAAGGLSEAELLDDPLAMFARWFDEVTAAGLHEPNAMALASVAADGAPSSRIVLLKGVGADGFRFFTNHGSRKARDLDAEPRCALLFGWHELERQVRVEGVATRLARADVAAYHDVRPRGSQLGAWASRQSEVLRDRAELEESYRGVEERFDGVDVPVPAGWGGYLVRPDVVEFWQGRLNRLHDRLVYRRTADGAGWVLDRLAP